MQNEIIEAMEARRSCRKFKPDMVPMELIDQVVEAGLWAASGMGKQSPIILKVTDKGLRDRIAAANQRIGGWKEGFDPFYGAPVVLVVLAPKDMPTYIYDGSLVMGNLMLAAHALGLGSCWIHRAQEEFEMPEFQTLLAELGIEGAWEGIGHCVLGYSDGGEGKAAPRKEDRVWDADQAADALK